MLKGKWIDILEIVFAVIVVNMFGRALLAYLDAHWDLGLLNILIMLIMSVIFGFGLVVTQATIRVKLQQSRQ
ncbi:hypothetical protein OIT44_00850 [Weissella ceti]|uniref:Uncharacterized protein n=1 Tax=Weissella ceti TaxID=759620 RepID=A0ABT3E2I0_9LACO|nr:hypothetical protein [Weissella ceti]MCW0952624.1 hypothetical protein [Weissella ceti]QVK12329.1 hypothetical protein KHQ31_01490 [Weissella ceti]